MVYHGVTSELVIVRLLLSVSRVCHPGDNLCFKKLKQDKRLTIRAILPSGFPPSTTLHIRGAKSLSPPSYTLNISIKYIYIYFKYIWVRPLVYVNNLRSVFRLDESRFRKGHARTQVDPDICYSFQNVKISKLGNPSQSDRLSPHFCDWKILMNSQLPGDAWFISFSFFPWIHIPVWEQLWDPFFSLRTAVGSLFSLRTAVDPSMKIKQ